MGRINDMTQASGSADQDSRTVSARESDEQFAIKEAEAFMSQRGVDSLDVFNSILDSLDYSDQIKALMTQRASEDLQ